LFRSLHELEDLGDRLPGDRAHRGPRVRDVGHEPLGLEELKGLPHGARADLELPGQVLDDEALLGDELAAHDGVPERLVDELLLCAETHRGRPLQDHCLAAHLSNLHRRKPLRGKPRLGAVPLRFSWPVHFDLYHLYLMCFNLADERPSTGSKPMPFKLNVNGKPATVDVPPQMPLLWVLRDVLDLKGPKFG